MKRIICAVLAVVMIVSLAGCGGEKPEEVVERVTQAIKEGKMESVKENIDLNALESLLPDSGSESTKAATSEESLISGGKASYFPIDDTLGKITVKILSSEKDGDHATVKAECTAVDLTEFLKGYMQKSMENALVSQRMTPQRTRTEPIRRRLFGARGCADENDHGGYSACKSRSNLENHFYN